MYTIHKISLIKANAGNQKFNTTIFVGGVDQYTTEDELKNHFLPFGKIVSVKV
jgi:RNA recognition motif-containing protein